MGKNRKKPRSKGAKNRRYEKWSNASMNTGPTPAGPGSGHKAPSGLMQVGIAAYKERAASIGQPEPQLWRKRDELAGQARYVQNAVRIATMREVWKGQRHQGVEDYNAIVVKEIKFYYRLSLLFSGRQFVWRYEDWRTEKVKFSIIYGSKERAFEVMNSERGITWKTETPLS